MSSTRSIADSRPGRAERIRRTLAVLAVVLFTAAAADRTAELDDLFRQLSQSQNREDASDIEKKIWDAWKDSGSDSINLLMQRADRAVTEGRWPEALGTLHNITRLSPDFAEGWNRRATLYYLMDDFDSSIADVSRTLALEPRHFGALSGLGAMMRLRGQFDAATDAYRRALAVHPYLAHAKDAIRRMEEAASSAP